jgi:hypothetical protein
MSDRCRTLCFVALALNWSLLTLRPASAQHPLAPTSLVAPPVIVAQPMGQAAEYGANVTLSVTATGVPLLYQWHLCRGGSNVNQCNSLQHQRLHRRSNLRMVSACHESRHDGCDNDLYQRLRCSQYELSGACNEFLDADNHLQFLGGRWRSRGTGQF